MTARRSAAIASTTVLALAVATALVASGQAETAAPSTQSATHTATPTTSQTAARERPRGVIADCSKGSGIGGGGSLNVFRSRGNLVIGPLAMTGAAVTPGYYHPGFRGNKFPLYVRSGHRVTLALTRETRGRAGLFYSPLVTGAMPDRDGYRVITFSSCRRGEYSPGRGSKAGRVSFWAGGVVAPAPLCVPLLVWVDEEPSPRRAVIDLGVGSCG